ncbi:hypothetical protein CEXT_240141 [Caerostris extrusa]|uniref:Uncharacterized protein n=1 Tax=Caerostris extrusa TaxID=172846 RepID=A0AAV4PUQ8_CAEEX|nr:hypothetical protein CEXT_240141 [Caerostris extrusa]
MEGTYMPTTKNTGSFVGRPEFRLHQEGTVSGVGIVDPTLFIINHPLLPLGASNDLITLRICRKRSIPSKCVLPWLS